MNSGLPKLMSTRTLKYCPLYLDILRVFSNVTELRILRLDYHGFKVGHKSRDWCCKKRRKYTQRHTEERPGFCGGRLELTQPHPRTPGVSRIHWKLQEKHGTNSLRTLPTPWFQTFGLQNCERIHLSPPGRAICYRQPYDADTAASLTINTCVYTMTSSSRFFFSNFLVMSTQDTYEERK